MTNTNCLNCGKALNDKFCSGCGQKADTHRISFKHFIFHDLLHGTFHIEKGMLFTAKQALIRPGKAALDYISGKRIRYYNVFYLILITSGLMLFFRHIDELFYSHSEAVADEKIYLNDASKKLDEIISQGKIVLLFFVPMAAFNSFILFRRKKLNLSEHFILSGMVLLGILLLGTFANIYFPINNFLNINDTLASLVITAIILSYVCYAYANAFGSDYSRLGTACRIVLFYLLLSLEVFILFLVLYGIVTDWEFGKISVSPFG